MNISTGIIADIVRNEVRAEITASGRRVGTFGFVPRIARDRLVLADLVR